MNLDGVTYRGPMPPDGALLRSLPRDLVSTLRECNGFIAFGGGLHLRGACPEPEWHSLATVWTGEFALHRLFPNVSPEDIPFAQDCLADQLLLRAGSVCKLQSETGQCSTLGMSLKEFLQEVQRKPVEMLGLQPLLRFTRDGGLLAPGQVLHAYPPFCTKEASRGVSLKAVPALQAIAYLADLSKQLGSLRKDTQFRVTVRGRSG